MHCSAFLVGGLKRAPQIFFLIFFVWVVLFGHNYGPVNQKKLTGIVPAELEKVPPFVLLILQFNLSVSSIFIIILVGHQRVSSV